jgi:hypothetical protein
MKKSEQGGRDNEGMVGKNWFKVVLENRMKSYQGESGEASKAYEEARRVLNHVYTLSQDNRMWKQDKERPELDWSQAATITQEIADALKVEVRRLNTTEEGILTALVGAYGLSSDRSGLGDILSGFSFQREPVVISVIEKLQQGDPSPDYLKAVEAFGSELRPPVTP